MLIYHRTSLLSSNAQTVVNTVNCVGVMGKGIAAEFKNRYPTMFKIYKKLCDDKLLKPGKLWLWRGEAQWVLNFPTKNHWRHPSKLEWIEAGLRKFVTEYEKRGVTEISFPRLGCGNGGLEWDDVRPLMESYLSSLPITVFVHDFEVSMEQPEHTLKGEEVEILPEGVTKSYREFESYLRRSAEQLYVTLRKQSSGDLSTTVPEENGTLSVVNLDGTFDLDADVIHDLWTSFQKGLVTTKSIEGTVGDRAAWILDFLSALPDVRRVQVEDADLGYPETAIEIQNRRLFHSLESLVEEQPKLQWP